MSRPTPFDPDAAAIPHSGVYGLPHGEQDAAVWLLPVPFDATTSYGSGAANGPTAIRQASVQVDLCDLQTGRAYERGIFMLPESAAIRDHNRAARRLAEPILARGGAEPSDRAALDAIDAAGVAVNDHVRAFTQRALAADRIPGVVGGDHSVPLGAIQAAAQRFPGIGILHIDAHMDLRDAYEGFAYSHASIMHNVLRTAPGVARLVQIGIRDFGAAEFATANHDPRIVSHFDLTWQHRLASGQSFLQLCHEAIDALPPTVWVSFDIDGLDPSLCPGTGTPVPGGLTFGQACILLQTLTETGRRVVGFDLCEVSPRPGDEWDGNVGARVLYKLCGFAIHGAAS